MRLSWKDKGTCVGAGGLELEFHCCFSGVKEEFLGRHCQGQEERYRSKSRREDFTHSPAHLSRDHTEDGWLGPTHFHFQRPKEHRGCDR